MKKILWLTSTILWLTGCGQAPVETKPAAALPPVRVKTVKVAEQSWPLMYEATGTVRARTSTVIAAKIMGYVREVNAQTGDHIREGQLLIALESKDLDVSANRANAALEEVRSSIPEADSGVAAAKANVDLAQTTFNRMQELWNKKSISNQEFDEASAKLKASQAAYQMAQARRAQLDAQLARAQQDVRAAEVTKGYARIVAPFSGIVTAKAVDLGTLAVPGAALLTIEQEGSFRLEAWVEESHMKDIRVGQPVWVTLDGSDRTFNARVSELTPTVDAASRSYIVKIDLPAGVEVRSGSFGRASFTLGKRSVLSIPFPAVTERGQLQSVMVAENGIAHTRLISTGRKYEDQLEVLSGLTAGETLIFPVPHDLADGSRVEVRP
jgi:membrane fusion protein, multidrug efflux system